MKSKKTNDLEWRKKLIETIAKRHAAERAFIKTITVKENTSVSDEYNNTVSDEYKSLLKSSINPTNF